MRSCIGDFTEMALKLYIMHGWGRGSDSALDIIMLDTTPSMGVICEVVKGVTPHDCSDRS